MENELSIEKRTNEELLEDLEYEILQYTDNYFYPLDEYEKLKKKY